MKIIISFFMGSLSHLEIVWLVDGVADPAVARLAPTVSPKNPVIKIKVASWYGGFPPLFFCRHLMQIFWFWLAKWSFPLKL